MNKNKAEYQSKLVQMKREGRLRGAIKDSEFFLDHDRVDRKGNEIKSGKKYAITYIDIIEKKPLEQVHLVESYKKYNAEDISHGDTPCCTIF